MSVLHISADEARAQISDPLIARIAERLWQHWGYTDDQTREVEEDHRGLAYGSGQWNYCVADAEALADLFREMAAEQG
jgi:hypothetical protein